MFRLSNIMAVVFGFFVFASSSWLRLGREFARSVMFLLILIPTALTGIYMVFFVRLQTTEAISVGNVVGWNPSYVAVSTGIIVMLAAAITYEP